MIRVILTNNSVAKPPKALTATSREYNWVWLLGNIKYSVHHPMIMDTLAHMNVVD